MSGTTNSDTVFPTLDDVCQQWQQATGNLATFNRLLTTDAKIAQTPKQLIWTLNKAKLYRYAPVVPEEQRHKTPLLLGLRDHEPAACARPAAGAQLRRVHAQARATTSTCSTGACLAPKTASSSSTTTRWSICRA